jgi:hypothetical protein
MSLDDYFPHNLLNTPFGTLFSFINHCSTKLHDHSIKWHIHVFEQFDIYSVTLKLSKKWSLKIGLEYSFTLQWHYKSSESFVR